MRRAAALLLGLALAGCGSMAPRPGGYYKDDGPGANPPPNLASIPDATPRAEPLRQAANAPYEVLGHRYVPLTSVQAFHQRGVASWYGRRFNGEKTSSGERYDMYAMTAAHPTLPIPSYARVTNVANGRSVVVRINDRGPFLSGRVIDLSYAAAYKLGFVNAGSALVDIDAVVPGEARYFVQLGAFSERAGAESLRGEVASRLQWLSGTLQVLSGAGGALWRLQAGPYASADAARSVADRIETELNLKPYLLVR